mmetsp:Transcript_28619/g.79978  ORF Transcript_28619/g.79978 Transcript_28619/m.79978 type:complete len:243 (-) Transcript_28619:707-1435(-)
MLRFPFFGVSMAVGSLQRRSKTAWTRGVFFSTYSLRKLTSLPLSFFMRVRLLIHCTSLLKTVKTCRPSFCGASAVISTLSGDSIAGQRNRRKKNPPMQVRILLGNASPIITRRMEKTPSTSVGTSLAFSSILSRKPSQSEKSPFRASSTRAASSPSLGCGLNLPGSSKILSTGSEQTSRANPRAVCRIKLRMTLVHVESVRKSVDSCTVWATSRFIRLCRQACRQSSRRQHVTMPAAIASLR